MLSSLDSSELTSAGVNPNGICLPSAASKDRSSANTFLSKTLADCLPSFFVMPSRILVVWSCCIVLFCNLTSNSLISAYFAPVGSSSKVRVARFLSVARLSPTFSANDILGTPLALVYRCSISASSNLNSPSSLGVGLPTFLILRPTGGGAIPSTSVTVSASLISSNETRDGAMLGGSTNSLGKTLLIDISLSGNQKISTLCSLNFLTLRPPIWVNPRKPLGSKIPNLIESNSSCISSAGIPSSRDSALISSNSSLTFVICSPSTVLKSLDNKPSKSPLKLSDNISSNSDFISFGIGLSRL